MIVRFSRNRRKKKNVFAYHLYIAYSNNLDIHQCTIVGRIQLLNAASRLFFISQNTIRFRFPLRHKIVGLTFLSDDPCRELAFLPCAAFVNDSTEGTVPKLCRQSILVSILSERPASGRRHCVSNVPQETKKFLFRYIFITFFLRCVYIICEEVVSVCAGVQFIQEYWAGIFLFTTCIYPIPKASPPLSLPLAL